MTTTSTWIVTIDDESARLISRSGPTLDLIEHIDHPQRHMHDDAPRDMHGEAQRVAQSQAAFVQTVGERLHAGKQHQEFDQLVLVGGTQLLSLLRDSLDADTASAVYDTLPKDVRSLRIDELLPHVWHHLPRG